MKLTSEQVKKVAKLANIPITSEEANLYNDQLTEILGYIDKLNKVDTTAVEPTFNVSPNTNISHSDESKNCLSESEALQNAPKKADGLFVTKGVFGGE